MIIIIIIIIVASSSILSLLSLFIVIDLSDCCLQAESRCVEKLQAASGQYSQLLEEFGNAVGYDEAQNIHASVTNDPLSISFQQ